MLSEEMRRRIAALNRRELKHEEEVDVGQVPVSNAPPVDGAPPKGPSGKRRELPPPGIKPPDLEVLHVVPTAADARLRLSLNEVAPGEVIENEAGRFLWIEKPIQDVLHGGGGAFCARFVRAITRADAQFAPLVDTRPEDVLFVDIETTGLSAGTPLFLIGVLRYEADTLRVGQLLARDYTEEPALLLHFSGLLDASQVVVSFNGKTYDVPYIRDRSVFMGIPFRFRQGHIDMLHEARRRWRKQLPNCKLQTLEQYICKRVRRGDIPGAEIPDAYHRFVRTGNAVQMRHILHHNMLDLLTTAEVLTVAIEGESGKR